jgi:acetolactate synthase-1/2/3 large subunit
MFLNDAVRCEKRLTPIFNQHEQASAIAAEGYVRAGNGMGVVSVTTGPEGQTR